MSATPAMAPYEVTSPGGSVEYHNAEPGNVWMHRMAKTFDKLVWLNPVQEQYWEYTPSILMLRELVEGKMFPHDPWRIRKRHGIAVEVVFVQLLDWAN